MKFIRVPAPIVPGVTPEPNVPRTISPSVPCISTAPLSAIISRPAPAPPSSYAISKVFFPKMPGTHVLPLHISTSPATFPGFNPIFFGLAAVPAPVSAKNPLVIVSVTSLPITPSTSAGNDICVGDQELPFHIHTSPLVEPSLIPTVKGLPAVPVPKRFNIPLELFVSVISFPIIPSTSAGKDI